jgi:hypothetical protein
MPTVVLKVWSNIHHLQQAYAGFSMLSFQHKITLKQRFITPSIELINAFSEQYLAQHYQSCFIAEIDNKVTIAFDMHDSFEVNPYLIEHCDFYVKRSYAPSYIETLNHKAKCIPYGPFYEVYSNQFDPFLLQRGLKVSLEWKLRIRSMMRAFPLLDNITSMPREAKLSAITPAKSNKIIFSVNMHDPFDNPNRSQENIDRRIELIEQRADIVRALRKEFPKQFIGGVKDNATARKFSPDCILKDPDFFKKENYIQNLQQAAIGISSQGLFNSIGGKFGEYIALGKAIVTTPLDYFQGEGLIEGENFLAGNTVDKMVEHCTTLMSDTEFISQMSEKNQLYYQEFLKPDKKINNICSKINLFGEDKLG